MTKLNFIVTTLNGYIIETVPLADEKKGDKFDLDNLYEGDKSNERVDEDFSGGMKSNVFLEKWMTETLGYYEDIYVGLQFEK